MLTMDPSKPSSSSYKVNKQQYDENYDRIFNKPKQQSYEKESNSQEGDEEVLPNLR